MEDVQEIIKAQIKSLKEIQKGSLNRERIEIAQIINELAKTLIEAKKNTVTK